MPDQKQVQSATYINTFYDANNKPDHELDTVLFRIDCVSSENLAITQNKTQDTVCRSDSDQIDRVDSTNFVGTTTIEGKDAASRALIRHIQERAAKQLEIQVAYLKLSAPNRTLAAGGDPIEFLSEPTVYGDVLTGIPDITDTRDAESENLQFTLSRTRGSLEHKTYTEFRDGTLNASATTEDIATL